jgi:hypothetical protein
MNSITWSAQSLLELAPQAVPVRRRVRNFDASRIFELYPKGGLYVINGKLYVTGKIVAVHGWTNDLAYHKVISSPVPAAKWSDNWDSAAGMTNDVWWDIGLSFCQRWQISGSTIVPETPLYVNGTPRTQIEVTPGRFKTVEELLAVYRNAAKYATAPWEFRNDIENGTRVEFTRSLVYAPGTSGLAQDGLNGLTHMTEFVRPDGSWVAVRDNLLNAGTYYASQKSTHDEYYPPGWRTNLYGGALPTSRELPDGRPFIVCNSPDRKDMYITVSQDGYLFDKTWLLLHSDQASDGGLFKSGGPQYFQSYVIGNNAWIIYSITKQQIGITKVPSDALR